MFGVFTAVTAIFPEFEFFRRIDFISLRYVVLTFAHGANKRKQWSLILFSHGAIISYYVRLLKKFLVDDRVKQCVDEKKSPFGRIMDVIYGAYVQPVAVAIPHR